MLDAIEVVARLGNTVLDVRYVTDGRYAIADHVFDLSDLGHPETARVGLVELTMRRVESPKPSVPAPVFERRLLEYVAGSLVAHLALWLLLPELPAPARSHRGGGAVVEAGPIAMRMVATTVEIGDSPDHATNGAGAPTAGSAGAAGSTTAQRASGHIQVAKRDDIPRLSRQQAIEAARDHSFLGSRSIGDGFRTLTGTADLSSGFDRADIYAPLYGGIGEGGVSFGLARAGQGESAGCAGGCSGSIGVGRIGTLSNGNVGGTGWGGSLAAGPGPRAIGSGRGVGDGWRRETRVPTVVICGTPRCVNAVGALDKAIIRRYIRRELPKIQYCYEKELLATPGLAGTVTTEFLIATDGTVQTATASGVAEPVASCVARVLRNIKFPRAQGDQGSTQVHYPFEFRSAGS